MNHAAPPERPGQAFHDLVAKLELMFAHRDGVRVDAPLRLPDADTGRLREHDVVITRETHHGKTLTAIECRDHARKVGVPQIEGFAKKCERTGIHRGILVASNGFTQTASRKAAALNLTCMELAEAQAFAWIGDVTVIGQCHNFSSVTIRVRIDERGPELQDPYVICSADGSPYLGDDAQALVLDRLPPEVRNARSSRVHHDSVVVPMEGVYVLDASGTRFPVLEAVITYVLEIEVVERPMTLHNCAGDEAAMEIASGQLLFSEGESTVALVKTEDGVMGYVLSKGVLDHRVRIGDLPERRLVGRAPA